MKAVSEIKKLKTAVQGYCDLCKKPSTLEYRENDVKLTLCNECAGHFAIAEFWLHRYGMYPCVHDKVDRGTALT